MLVMVGRLLMPSIGRSLERGDAPRGGVFLLIMSSSRVKRSLISMQERKVLTFAGHADFMVITVNWWK